MDILNIPGKGLCIAEKPSVSREQKAIAEKNGYGNRLDFASFHGHLMKLPQADFYDPKYEKWKKEDLPIIPDFVYVEEDTKSCKELLSKIRNGGYSYIINSCDAGREGELIFYSFYEAEGLTLPVYRLWASDVTEETMNKAFHNLFEAKHFDGLREASKLRAKADWLAGINFTRAATLQAQTKVPIGRVLSPTLALIVEREKEIRAFVEEDLFEVHAKFEGSAGTYEGIYMIPPELKEFRFKDKAKAEEAKAKVGKTGVVKDVVAVKQATKAPSLYSLVELQKDASRYFGFKADKTLNIAQSLYETHKVLTYPRTESRFLPTSMVGEIWDHINPISSIPELEPYVKALQPQVVDSVMHSKSYVDNAKITDHHALIPTKIKPNLSKMSEDEKKIYTLVCKRLLAIFMSAYEVEKTTITTVTDDGSTFRTTGKVVTNPGFSVLYTHDSKDVILPPVKKGDSVKVSKVGIATGKTRPPKRYTTDTLLAAMQNVGQKLTSSELRKILRETAGLGTSATRAEILKKLENYNYVVTQRQSYVPTDFGMAVVESFGNQGIFSPELTAKWESKLQDIESGKMAPTDFYREMVEYTKRETGALMGINCNLRLLSYPIVGECPFCHAPLRSYKDYFVCDNYKSPTNPCIGCYSKKFLDHVLTDAEFRGILKGKPTKVYKLTSEKQQKSWNSAIGFDPEKKKITFAQAKTKSFEKTDTSKVVERSKICDCPVCGGTIYKAKNFYLCSNRADLGCEFKCGITIAHYNVTEEDIKEICKYGHTLQKKDFIWKSGKKGSARLSREGNNIKFDFN